MVLEQGLRFTLRDGRATIGTGVVTQVKPNLTPEEVEKLLKGKSKEEREELKKKLQELEDSLQEAQEAK